MLKKAITYTDIDGVVVTEEFHFQIDQSEAAKMLMIEGDGYEDKMKKLIAERDGEKIMEAFDKLLSAAVGKREGKLFVKDPSITRHFKFSGAYNALFMELLKSEDSGGSFLAGMFPAEAQGEIQKTLQEQGLIPAEKAVEGTVLDAQVQDGKPQPDTIPKPSDFPQTLERLQEEERVRQQALQTVESPKQGKDDEPAWLQETRYPTKQELMRMGNEEMQLAMKMKAAKAFG